MKNDAQPSMTGSSANSLPTPELTNEAATDILPVGSLSGLKTIRMLNNRIADNPDGADVKEYAKECVRLTNELIERFQQQRAAVAV